MGLKGNLSTVSLADVFQVLTHGQSSGLLRIQCVGGMRMIEIQNGTISIIANGTNRIPLGDLLQARGLLSQDQLNQALERQRQSADLLGNILTGMGFVSREDIEAALRFQIEEEICDLFMLKEAEFDFLANAKMDEKMALGGGVMRLKIDPNAVLLEAAKRVDDWATIEKRIPDQAMLFQLAEPGAQILESGEGMSAEGLVLLTLVSERRSVESMVQKGCLGRVNTNHMLIELWDAGLVEPSSLEAYGEAARKHLDARRMDEAKRLAQYALTLEKTPQKREALNQLLADIEQKERFAALPGHAALRNRSEVIRRAHPALLVKQRRSPVTIAALVALGLLLVAGGVLYFQFWIKDGGAEGRGQMKMVDLLVGEADRLVTQRKYREALEVFNQVFTNPGAQKKRDENFKKILDEIKAKAGETLNRFHTERDSLNEEKITAFRKDYECLRNIPHLPDSLNDELQEIGDTLRRWEDKKLLETFKLNLEQVRKLPAGDAQAQELGALLERHPPEEIAFSIRELQAALLEQRLAAQQHFESGQRAREAGDLRMARLRLKTALEKTGQSKLAAEIQTQLAALEQQLAQTSQHLGQLNNLIIQQDFEKARTGLAAFLKASPDVQATLEARTMLRRLPISKEEEAAQQAAKALEQPGLEGAERRKKILEFARQYPYSNAIEKLTLALTVTSDPPGAEIHLGARKAPAPTPHTLNVELFALVHITLRKPGFEDCDLFVRPEQSDKIEARLIKKPALPLAQLPYPALDGLAAKDGCVAVLSGGEVAFWREQAPEKKPLVRVQRGTATELPKNPAAKTSLAPLHHPLFLAGAEELELLVPTNQNRIWRLNPKTGSAKSLSLESPPVSQPVLVTFPLLPDNHFIGIATRQGFECLDLKSGSPRFGSLTLPAGAGPPEAAPIEHSESQFLIPRLDGKLHVVNSESGKVDWSVSMPAEPLPPPALLADGSAVAVGGAKEGEGKVLVWEAAAKGQKPPLVYDLGSPCAFPVLAVGNAFVVLTRNGELQRLAADSVKVLWKLPGNEKRRSAPQRVGDQFLAYGEGTDLLLVDAVAGTLAWRSPLLSPVVRIAVDKKKIYVSTEDALLWVFEAE